MALGINTEAAEGGDFTPIVKYDARVGHFFRIDRAQDSAGQWQTTPEDITDNFSAVFDLENIETGWMLFKAGSPPDYRVQRIGAGTAIEQPSEMHKEGYRILIKLGACAGGTAAIREISGNAKAAIQGMNTLHDAYMEGVKSNAGKLPVVKLGKPIAKVSSGGGQKSTNFIPVYVIERWVPRPADLVYAPRSAAAPAAKSNGVTQGPPSTGSTKVSAPNVVPLQKPTAKEDAEDFG